MFTIVKRGPANTVLEPVNGGRQLRAPHSMLTDPKDAPAASVSTFDAEFYDPGEFVRIPSGKHAGLYVVIADRGADKVNLVKPGGEKGRYLRATKRGLVRVDVSEVLK